MSSYKNIWVLAEHQNNSLLPVYKEILAKAKYLACEIENCKIGAVIIGSGIGNVVAEAEESGADLVYVVDDERLLHYNCDTYTAVLESLANQYKPLTFLFGATALGSELAPSVAARIKTGLAAHCVDITTDKDGAMAFVVPAFGGKVLSDILIPNHKPQMASVRPGIFEAEEFPRAKDLQTIKVDCPALPESRISFESFTPAQESDLKLEDADLVICCGRGVGTDEVFCNAKKLAKKLNAAIGYTRPAVDLGWAPDESDMIGASGKAVKPKVYLGFGVSGATQHLCGINKSGMIISVNKDCNAKMFNMSDYKIVSDSAAMINALLAAIDNN